LLRCFQWITLPRPFGAGSTEAGIFRQHEGQCQTFAFCHVPRAWHRLGMSSHRPPRAPFVQPPPDAASLREAALNYLQRYATTEAGLRIVLQRRIDRWARKSTERDDLGERVTIAKAAIPEIVARMVELGLLNDAAYAENRAKGLALSGRSRRAILARLMAKGIDADQARGALPEVEGGELVSALILARKRRIGPFRKTEPDPNREMGMMARAGFPRDVALRALAMDTDEAEAAIIVGRS
jgi:regulatory protein